MRGLKERLDRRLFVRGPRGITLTADGEWLLERSGAARTWTRSSTRCDDVLTLSLMPSMASAWLLPRLGGFLAAHSQLEINLQSTSDLVDFARGHEVDAALRGDWLHAEASRYAAQADAPVAPAKRTRTTAHRMQNESRMLGSRHPRMTSKETP